MPDPPPGRVMAAPATGSNPHQALSPSQTKPYRSRWPVGIRSWIQSTEIFGWSSLGRVRIVAWVSRFSRFQLAVGEEIFLVPYTVECQKRGLHHIHCLVWLTAAKSDKTTVKKLFKDEDNTGNGDEDTFADDATKPSTSSTMDA
ncbi:unnamed protein product [Urochloa humidicola]